MLSLGKTTKEVKSGKKMRPSLPKINLQGMISLYAQLLAAPTRQNDFYRK